MTIYWHFRCKKHGARSPWCRWQWIARLWMKFHAWLRGCDGWSHYIEAVDKERHYLNRQ